MVVDDEVDTADSLAEALEGPTRDVRAVYDWVAALDAYFEFRPDVCLIDIGLPGMDGYYVARSIRAMQGHRPLLVAVTGRGPEFESRSRQAGFDFHVTKPASAADIAALIERRTPAKPCA